MLNLLKNLRTIYRIIINFACLTYLIPKFFIDSLTLLNKILIVIYPQLIIVATPYLLSLIIIFK